MLSLPLVFLATALFPIAYIVTYWIRNTRRTARFPPGPPTRLGYGNLHQIPRSLSFKVFDKWAKEYGPLTGFKLGSRNVVLINDASLVHELFVKRAALFSERPRMHIAQGHVLPDTWHTYSLFLRGDCSQRVRTIAKPYLTGAGLLSLAPVHKATAASLVYNLLQSSENWLEHLNSWVFSTPVALMSGRSIKNLGNDWVSDFQNTQNTMTSLLDDPLERPWHLILPSLEFLPFWQQTWKRNAQIARNGILRAYGAVMAQCNSEKHGDFKPLIWRMQAEQDANERPLSEQEVKVMSGSLLLDAAVKSSLMTFQIILLALVSHPSAQKQAQAEVRREFGDSLPESIDLEKLPYLTACIYEALRWRPLGSYPIGPFGLPRESVQDVEFNGYHIPKGTTVVLNQWTIAHDADFYEAPEEYHPERFIADKFGAKPDVPPQPGRKPIYSFGAGRRECPGKDYFLQNIRITFAQILWAFDVVPTGPVDTDPATGFKTSVALKPNPFRVEFMPRSVEVAEAIRREKDKGDGVLGEWFD